MVLYNLGLMLNNLLIKFVATTFITSNRVLGAGKNVPTTVILNRLALTYVTHYRRLN